MNTIKNIFCSVLFLSSTTTFAQNLVVNPSFEDGAQCDGTTERVDTVDGWSPIAGRPGFINTNCPLSKESKSFVQGMKLPPASQGKVLAIQKFDTKGEFQQGRLTQTLEKDKQYVVSMRIRLPIQFCNESIQEVGVLFSEETLKTSLERRSINQDALALKNNSQTLLTQQYEWEEISALYTAKGNEQFIAIGNFTNTNKGIFENRTKKQCTYLFIDVLSVAEFKEIRLPVYESKMALKKDERLLLKEVEFEEGSDVLKKVSHQILDVLAQTLLDNPSIKVEVSSHTDNSLDATESITFSRARAKAIVQYLKGKEVLDSQLVELGRGSASAIALNSSAKGRKLNERIELRFLKL